MTTSETPSKSTFLPAAECGASLQGSPDGPIADLFGQPLSRAKAKASPASDSAPTILGSCGLTVFGSSVPDGPLASWESRLRQRLARIGSTESALIWKTKATPSGRSISRLAPSMLHTNDSASTGSRLTTPSSRDWKDSAGMATESEDGRQRLDQLPRQMVSYSPTPRASDGEKGGPNMAFGAGGLPLPTVMHSYNPTPTVADVQGGRKARSGARAGEPLLNGLLAAYNATPVANPANGTPEAFLDRKRKSVAKTGRSMGICLSDLSLQMVVAGTALSGPITNGSSAPSTAKRGAPNPEFPFWLMGFPDEWICGALAAMQSFRSSRLKSSKPTSKPKIIVEPPPWQK